MKVGDRVRNGSGHEGKIYRINEATADIEWDNKKCGTLALSKLKLLEPEPAITLDRVIIYEKVGRQ